MLIINARTKFFYVLHLNILTRSDLLPVFVPEAFDTELKKVL